MEHTFQQQIISEICKYQRLIKRFEVNRFTTFCAIPQDEYEPENPEHIRSYLYGTDKAIQHFYDKINMLRNEYETVVGKVCPV